MDMTFIQILMLILASQLCLQSSGKFHSHCHLSDECLSNQIEKTCLEVRKCCPENQTLDNWYNCKNVHDSGRFYLSHYFLM